MDNISLMKKLKGKPPRKDTLSFFERIKYQFDWKRFKHLVLVTLVGCLISLLPLGAVYLLQPSSTLSLMGFFADYEIIYVCIAVAVAASLELFGYSKSMVVYIANLLFILAGSLAYAFCKAGHPFPILGGLHDPKFGGFNVMILGIIFVIETIGYAGICMERR